MKKVVIATLVALSAMFASSMTFAATCADINNISGISAAQRQQLVITCEQEKLNVVSPNGTSIEVASQWGQVAKDWAEAIGIAAGELGYQVNEFIKTDAGKFTAVLIAWQVLGESVMNFVKGLLVLTLLPALYFTLIRLTNPYETARVPVKYLWGLIETTKRVRTNNVKSSSAIEEHSIVIFVGGVVVTVIGLIAILTM